MVKYTILLIIMIVSVIAIFYLVKKKRLDALEELENEKLHIQHQPIFEELTKVKQLNMTGEAEQKFERWREEWTEVVDVDMVRIDALLHEAEEALGRFRTGEVRDIELEIQDILIASEKKKDRILKELDELVGSEERNRIEIEQLSEAYRNARKTILTRQFDYGEAYPLIESKVEELMPKFQQYEKETENGNYLTAREIVTELSREGERVFEYVKVVPTLLNEIKVEIPATLREIRHGIYEMEHTGYDVRHLEIVEQLDTLDEMLEYLREQLGMLEIQLVRNEIIAIQERIELFYKLLEDEVASRHRVEQAELNLQERILDAMFRAKEAMEEARFVQESYRLDEKEADIPRKIGKRLDQLYSQHDTLLKQISRPNIAYTLVDMELTEIQEVCEQMEVELDEFSNKMDKLRIDEMHVRESLDELEEVHREATRTLYRANIPGIPEDVNVRLEEADEKIFLVRESLKEKPLNIAVTESYLEDAKNIVQLASERVYRLLEDVRLFEQTIQYGNRYRTMYPELDEAYTTAEEEFAAYRYSKALETAMFALESVEEGATERIQQSVSNR